MRHKRLKVGILGCGAIGSGIAQAVQKELKDSCELTGLYDIREEASKRLAARLHHKTLAKSSLAALVANCDLMVEAVNAKDTKDLIKQAVMKKKHVLAMSVGKLFNAQPLFRLARLKGTKIILPSGAIAGLDAVKSASLRGIKSIKLTSRKPLSGFYRNAYLESKGIELNRIKKETVLFEGPASQAVKYFPQNINVAATLALASGHPRKVKVCIKTSPQYKRNSHEIEMTGDFGHLYTKTENVVCPDNPKTSYLAVLSGIQSLKQFSLSLIIGN